jgi:hypothetical protein
MTYTTKVLARACRRGGDRRGSRGRRLRTQPDAPSSLPR